MIPKIPEFITKTDLQAWVKTIDVGIFGVTLEDLRRLDIRLDGIYLEVKERNERGVDEVDLDRNAVIAQAIWIPAKDPELDPDE